MNNNNVTITVNEILNYYQTDYKDKLVQTHSITGKYLENCFSRVYAMRRSARYDSARRYEFTNKELEEQYQNWKQKHETIGMYYGSATVD